MKLIKFENIDEYDINFTCGISVGKREFMVHQRGAIEALAVKMIASNLANQFCKEYGDEIIAKVDKEAVLRNILGNEGLTQLESMLGSVADGRCMDCGEHVRDYESPLGSFAPEIWATMREQGINPENGHRESCKYNK